MKQDIIFNSMTTSLSASLKSFNDACDEICQAKYIIASGKISRLLITIASSMPLFKTFESIVTGYNFVSAFEKAKFRDEHGTPYLNPPTAPFEQICFTFCLLYAIDTGKIDLKNLLSTFFSGESSPNDEFERFCICFIAPFQSNINGLFNGKIKFDDEPAQAEIASTEEE